MEPVRQFQKDIFDRIDSDKKGRVIDSSVEEFAEKGYSAANINIIAENAGISVGSLYKYFESKNHLYLYVVNRGMTLLEEGLKPILGSELSLREKIEAIIDAIFEGARNYPGMYRLYNRFTSEGDSELARDLSTRMESITAQAYASLLRQARLDGVLSGNTDERILAFCMDNIFLTLQFSLGAEYWKNRMNIYLGDEILARESEFKAQLLLFITKGLGL